MIGLVLLEKYICSDIINLILSYLESSYIYNFCNCSKSCERYLKIFFNQFNYYFTDLIDISFRRRKYITKIIINDNWKMIKNNKFSQFEYIIIDNDSIDIRKFTGNIKSLKYLKLYKGTELLYPKNLNYLLELDISSYPLMKFNFEPKKFENLKSLTISNYSYNFKNLEKLKNLTTLNLVLSYKKIKPLPSNITNLKISNNKNITGDYIRYIILPQKIEKLIINPEISIINFSKNINNNIFPPSLKYVSLPPHYDKILDMKLELNYLQCNFRMIKKHNLSEIKSLYLYFSKFNKSVINNLIRKKISNKIVGIRFLNRISYSSILFLKNNCLKLKVLHCGSTITHLDNFSPKNIGDYFPKNIEEIYISNSKVYYSTPIIINMNKYKKLKKIVYC